MLMLITVSLNLDVKPSDLQTAYQLHPPRNPSLEFIIKPILIVEFTECTAKTQVFVPTFTQLWLKFDLRALINKNLIDQYK